MLDLQVGLRSVTFELGCAVEIEVGAVRWGLGPSAVGGERPLLKLKGRPVVTARRLTRIRPHEYGPNRSEALRAQRAKLRP